MDYEDSGLDIQAAMVDLVRKHPDKKTRPEFLLWSGLRIQTSDRIDLPPKGRVVATFRQCSEMPQQGFDLKLTDGVIVLSDGQKIQHLRTWFDPSLEPQVEYEFESTKGSLQFWNVYKRRWPNGNVTEERMTGNAGFWIEKGSDSLRVYHCSNGESCPPDFESMVVELKWFPDPDTPIPRG
jgi:hypothetical protein